MYMHEESLHKP